MKLDKFLRDANIVKYRRMLSEPIDGAERHTILKLLAEEMAQQKRECLREPLSDAAAAERPVALGFDLIPAKGSDQPPS